MELLGKDKGERKKDKGEVLGAASGRVPVGCFTNICEVFSRPEGEGLDFGKWLM
jgi:hypothetical protein